MEEKTGRTSGSAFLKASLIITVFILVFCGYTAFSCWQNNKEILSEVQQAKMICEEAMEERDAKELELKQREKYRDELLDSINEIEDVKKEFFALAKETEDRILNGELDLKIAYLTFDDGPYHRSNQFLDVLDEYDVPATFFYLMKCSETGYAEEDAAYDAIYRRVINSGHTLANHTATHKLGKEGVYSSIDRFVSEVIRNREFIYDRYGYKTEIMRFPGGSDTSSKIPDIIPRLNELGYGYVDWNIACGDGGQLQPANVYRDNVLNNTKDKKVIVVLMHDYSLNTLEALPDIIEGLDKQGYIFLPLFPASSMCRH
ncbi:MAG: polysaccharide deacetylase family protein [Erysipelotrichaceae bacterium]|nr:polysaccharide deacetylase family protein [Erysipelotrichaceae bacterium]